MNQVKEKIFPYEPTRKIVIMGGSTAWVKEMKRLLPSVEIIQTNNNGSFKNVISKAEVVWINTWISHNHQDKILKETRKQKKDTKFFNFKGCQKCAEQIYLYENEGVYNNYLLK